MILGHFVYPSPYQYHYSTCELQAYEVGMRDEFIILFLTRAITQKRGRRH